MMFQHMVLENQGKIELFLGCDLHAGEYGIDLYRGDGGVAWRSLDPPSHVLDTEPP